MIKRFFDKINKKLKEKKGASLLIVVIAMSMLVVMGTIFSNLAYQSYKHSYGNICQQQANYTAKGLLDMFVKEFQNNNNFRQQVGQKLLSNVNENKEFSTQIDIKKLHSYNPDAVGNFDADTNTEDCKLIVSRYEKDNSKLKLTVSAKYKGFASSLSAILGYTNRAAIELSKIMNNALYITSPIADMMYYVQNQNNALTDNLIKGDVYIDAPKNTDAYNNISAMPNKDGYKNEATGGHTLGIDILGRPIKNEEKIKGEDLIPYLENSGFTLSVADKNKIKYKDQTTEPNTIRYFPKPKIDAEEKLVFIYGSEGDTYPLVDNDGVKLDITTSGVRFVDDDNWNKGEKKHNFSYDKFYYKNGDAYSEISTQLADYDQRQWLYERDIDGRYLLEYEPLRDGENGKKGNIKLDAQKWPVYMHENGVKQNAKWCIEGQRPKDNYEYKSTIGIYSYDTKGLSGSGLISNAEKYASYKVYQCEYMIPELDKDGKIVTKNGVVQYEVEQKVFKKNGDGSYTTNVALNSKLNGINLETPKSKQDFYCDYYIKDGEGYKKEKRKAFTIELKETDKTVTKDNVTYDVYEYYQVFYDENGLKTSEYPLYKFETKWILGEKKYKKAPPEGYTKDEWVADPKFGYGLEVDMEYGIHHNGALDPIFYFKFKDSRIGMGEGQYKPYEIPVVDEDGNEILGEDGKELFKRYDIQRYQRKRALKVVGGIELPKYRAQTTSNHWTEVYLRSHFKDSISLTGDVPIVIDGKLKCNTSVLLGLYNRGVDGNGSDHEFMVKENGQDKVTPVSFDTAKDIYTIPKYTCLRTSDDIYVNGDVRGENLICGGTLYAVDLDGTDDKTGDVYNKDGCKGNVVLEQMVPVKKVIGIPISLTTYMEVGKNYENTNVLAPTGKPAIVADGYVCVISGVADISSKVLIHGDIRAGKYNADGTKWGTTGCPLNEKGERVENATIPADKYYKEDGSNPLASDFGENIAGGIYGFNSGVCEERWNKKNRYELGSGDVVIQKARVWGDIYATGDVYINNGAHIYGNIYTPGNVYITKGEGPVVGRIGDKYDSRSRVFGSIYAGGDVAITGGCEVGDWKAKVNEHGYDSGVYCDGNLYIRGRVSPVKNHDAVAGGIYCNNLTILGLWGLFGAYNTKVGFHGGDIYIKGTMGGKANKNADNIIIGGQNNNLYYQSIVNQGEHFKFDKNNKVESTYVHSALKKDDTTNYTSIKEKAESIIKGELAKISTVDVNTKTSKLDDIKNILSAKIRPWSAPDTEKKGFYADKINKNPQNSDYIIGRGGSTKYQQANLIGKNANQEECFNYIVSENLMNINKIVLNDGDMLTFDTHKQNLHIKVSTSIEVGDNATIRIDGPNMANIYFGNNTSAVAAIDVKSDEQYKKGDNNVIWFGANCDVGRVIGIPIGVSENNAGLNIISNEKIVMVLNSGSKVKSYNYIPNGGLKFNLGENASAKPDGSYVINRLIGKNLDTMKLWSISFETKKSPLIMDGDTSFGGSDMDANGNGIADFQEYEWEVIKYE